MDMRGSVGGIIELIGPDCVVEGLGVAAGLVVVVLGVVECDGCGGVSGGRERG